MSARARPLLLASLVGLLLLAAPALPAPALAPKGTTPYFVPDVAPGFAVQPLAVAPGISALAFGPGDADGPDLYATTLGGQLLRFQLLWTPAAPLLVGLEVVAEGLRAPLGLWHTDGVWFVAGSHEGAESGRIDGAIWVLEPAGPRLVVDGLPNGRHNTNHLRPGPDGRLYIANGNPNDSGQSGGEPDVFPYSGAILSIDAAQVRASPAVLHWRDANGQRIPDDQIAAHPRNADFADKVHVLAWGFRNVYGIAFSGAGVGYTGMNGADVPSSQDAVFRIAPGTDYGFPFCYNEGPPGGVGAQVTVVPNPVYNDPARCAGTPPATALIGWHTCATGLDLPSPTGPWAFPAAFQDSVYVGECAFFFPDDWIVRQLEEPPELWLHSTSHKVRRVVLDDQGHAVEVRDFLSGLALPTDVLFGPDGAMYAGDIEAVYRVAPVAG